MTEKNIFAYKLFLSLNISNFNFFFFFGGGVKIATTPLKKVTPLFPSNPPIKVEVLSSPHPYFENLVGGSIPPPKKKQQ